MFPGNEELGFLEHILKCFVILNNYRYLQIPWVFSWGGVRNLFALKACSEEAFRGVEVTGDMTPKTGNNLLGKHGTMNRKGGNNSDNGNLFFN